jgi:hypothetical protein
MSPNDVEAQLRFLNSFYHDFYLSGELRSQGTLQDMIMTDAIKQRLQNALISRAAELITFARNL